MTAKQQTGNALHTHATEHRFETTSRLALPWSRCFCIYGMLAEPSQWEVFALTQAGQETRKKQCSRSNNELRVVTMTICLCHGGVCESCVRCSWPRATEACVSPPIPHTVTRPVDAKFNVVPFPHLAGMHSKSVDKGFRGWRGSQPGTDCPCELMIERTSVLGVGPGKGLHRTTEQFRLGG